MKELWHDLRLLIATAITPGSHRVVTTKYIVASVRVINRAEDFVEHYKKLNGSRLLFGANALDRRMAALDTACIAAEAAADEL